MATEQSSTGNNKDLSLISLIFSLLIFTESPAPKRPRRSKQDPQFVFDNTSNDETKIDTTKQMPIKPKIKPVRAVEAPDASADLYEPGDIVWCKLGGFPWWPALIVCLY